MQAFTAFFESMPPWAGNLPTWFVFAAVVIALIKMWPSLHKINLDATAQKRSGYTARITELEGKLEDQKKECDEREERLMGEVKSLHEEIFGMRKQHIQEQISFVRAIISSIDAPQLQTLLRALENGQRSLNKINGVNGPVKDKETEQ